MSLLFFRGEIGPGRPGGLLPQGSHGSGRAQISKGDTSTKNLAVNRGRLSHPMGEKRLTNRTTDRLSTGIDVVRGRRGAK